MDYELTGKLIEIFDEEQVSDRFRKREFVVEVNDGMYPQVIKLQLTQDKCSLIDGYSKGDEVTVRFNIRGRTYNKNGQTLYFTNLEAWRLSGGQSASTGNTDQAPKHDDSANSSLSEPPFQQADDDTLPF